MTEGFPAKARALLRQLDAHAPGEGAHGERVSVYAVATANELQWDQESLRELRWQAALHDIGKLLVDSRLLATAAGVEEEIQQHPLLGVEVLAKLSFPFDGGPVSEHHERWDGSGYPVGKKGLEISAGARIISVAEAFDAMTLCHWNPQRCSEQEALERLKDGVGKQFDLEVVCAFCEIQPLVQPLAP